MKAFALLLFVFVGAPRQEEIERAITDLINRLGDDEIEVRNKATDDLIRLGSRALESLNRRVAGTEGEIKSRIRIVISGIRKQERLKAVLGEDIRISLKAEKQSLKEIVNEVMRSTKTLVTVPPELDGERVTVNFRDLPFYQAMDRVCRAHGGILMRSAHYDRAGTADLLLEMGTSTAKPRSFDGPYLLELHRIEIVQRGKFGGAERASMSFQILVDWERRMIPLRIHMRLTEAIDDQGVKYEGRPIEFPAFPERFAESDFQIIFDRLPSKEARAFRRIAGVLEVEFPADALELKVDNPIGKQDIKVAEDSLFITLREFVRTEGGYTGRLDIPMPPSRAEDPERFERPEFLAVLRDKAGHEYSAAERRGHGKGGGPMTYQIKFPVPQGAEIAEFRFVLLAEKPGGNIVKRVPFAFENVKIR